MAKETMPTAHSLEEAANADNSLEGYAAINTGEHAEIARLAYQLYEERGGAHGSADEDWYRAEREIRERRSKKESGATTAAPEKSQNTASRDTLSGARDRR